MSHDILVWLLDLIRRAPEPIRTAAGSAPEAIEVSFWGRRFLVRVEELA